MVSDFAHYLIFSLFLAKVNFLVEVSEVCGRNLLQDSFVYTYNGLGMTLCVVCTWRAAYFSGRNVLGYTAHVWCLLISALQVITGKRFVGQRGELMKKLKKIKMVGLKEILVKHSHYTSKKIEQMRKEPMCRWVWRLELCARYLSVVTHVLGGGQLLLLSTNPETGHEELPLKRSVHRLTSVFAAAHLSPHLLPFVFTVAHCPGSSSQRLSVGKAVREDSVLFIVIRPLQLWYSCLLLSGFLTHSSIGTGRAAFGRGKPSRISPACPTLRLGDHLQIESCGKVCFNYLQHMTI